MKLAELLVENAVDDVVIVMKVFHESKADSMPPFDDIKKKDLKSVSLYRLGVTKESVYAVYFNTSNNRVRIHRLTTVAIRN